MKHDELWNDTINDILPTGSLEMMQKEARRLRVRRCIARASAVTTVIALFACLVFSTKIVPRFAQSRQKIQAKQTVRCLDDAALVSRLRDAGLGIAIHNTGHEKRVLLVSKDGQVFFP